MRYYKTGICVLLFFFVFCNVVFGVGVFENGRYVYYTNNSQPQISINITAGNERLFIDKGVFSSDNFEKVYIIPSEDRYLPLFASGSYNFLLDFGISNMNNPKFKLFVYDMSNNQVVPKGDSVDFSLVYDNVSPFMTYFLNDIKKSSKLMFKFNERISELKVSFDGLGTIRYNNIEYNNVLLNDIISIDVSSLNFKKDLYDITIEYVDLAGNVVVETKTVYVGLEDLKVELLTVNEDSSLKYNYDSKYPSFFNKTIYSSSSDFLIKIKTNKNANCFFSSSSYQFKEFYALNDKKLMESDSENLTHSVSVGKLDEKIWIACQNTYYESEIVYLSAVMGLGNTLINIEKYDPLTLSIIDFEPTGLVTNNPFSVLANTDNRAICNYRIDDAELLMMDTLNFTSFKKENVQTTVGTHELYFECFDVLGRKAVKNTNIQVDPNRGVSIVSYSPKYVAKTSSDIELTLSESNNDIKCRYSKTQKSKSSFLTLPLISNGVGNKRSFLLSGLVSGNNTVYIYCSKNDEISEDVISIIYDDKGMMIDNLKFINGKYKSDYLGSSLELELDFDLSSLVPVSKYTLTVVYKDDDNYSKTYSGSKPLYLKRDLNDSLKVVLVADNGLTTVTKEKMIKFDMDPPVVEIINVLQGKKITCTDPLSGCALIYYGFSKTDFDCLPNKIYANSSDVINVAGQVYMCAQAFDYVGLSSKVTVLVGDYKPKEEEKNTTVVDNKKDDKKTDTDDKKVTEPENPFKNIDEDDNTSDENNTGMIIGAVILLFATVGGGGYYAYKKGYLNKELEKLGIKTHMQNSGNDSLMQNNSSSAGKNNGMIYDSSSMPYSNRKVSSYDSGAEYDKHINKINSFIDSKISETSNVFAEFDEKKKKKDDDKDSDFDQKTLISKKKSKSNIIEEEDFDEFYKASKEIEKNIQMDDIKDQATSFEEYYKNKKKDKSELKDKDIKNKDSNKKDDEKSK